MGNVSGKSYVPEDGAEIDLRQFEFLRNIGKGAFGKVRIVQKRDTQKMYALKYINKKKCVRMDAVENILRERRILEELKHPFVVNLWFAFQDDVNIYMVLDLMLGGDLRFHFERIKYFPEEAIRFYAAEIGCALSYLHSKGIVHRDLKPDNLLLDDDGHIHITDFNIARKIEEGKVLRSHSGTLCYMEIFMDQGYTFSVDWWSLGIILFELTFGRTPFAGENHQGVQNDIVNAPLTFPSRHIIQKTHINPALECIDIIRRLLERNVPSRLSCGPSGIRDFCSHPWFDDLDWVALENLELKPPFSPKSGEINFDPIYDLEEILLEEDPLEYRPWKPKRLTETDSRKGIKAFQKSKSAADVQLEYLEQQFQTFDISIYDKYKGTEATPPGWAQPDRSYPRPFWRQASLRIR
ncbi:kinase-like protein [Polychytrium aggregatum]|uniref:kinase-like protein n=1 Tax=Polychytrium aggregatum TaxID=110093 RepID=UPI0022FE5A6B|nr:kinase-like protein [Polychytrium aggregatum]KAI9203129.1 kinase-like protein [Polychytrium aggregatum]